MLSQKNKATILVGLIFTFHFYWNNYKMLMMSFLLWFVPNKYVPLRWKNVICVQSISVAPQCFTDNDTFYFYQNIADTGHTEILIIF